MPLFHSFAQVREDLTLHTAGLSDDDVWRRTEPLPSLGFQLRHIAGSVDRLVTYLMGEELNAQQLEFLKKEAEAGPGLKELLAAVDASLASAEDRVRGVEADALGEPRYIGKKRLPSTVLGLLVHVAEHTQRHVGQAITTAKLARLCGG
jgi:uncharacterized damage-inducible protein DinB